MKRFLSISLVLVLLLAVTGCGGSDSSSPPPASSGAAAVTSSEAPADSPPQPAAADDTVYTLTFGTYNPSSGPDGQSAERFKEYAEEKSGGRLVVNIYHNSQLGDSNTQLENVMMGTQDFFLVSPDLLTPWEPMFGTVGLFYVFEDEDHLRKYYQSDLFAPALETIASHNLMFVNREWNFIMGPFRALVSRRPVNSFADLNNMRARVFDTTMMHRAWGDAFKCQTFVVAYNEIYLALEQGMIECFEVPMNVVRENSYCEVAKYVTATYSYPQLYNIVGSKSKMDSLPEDLREIVYEAAYAAGETYTSLVREAGENDIAYLESELGVTFFDELDLQPFYDAMAEVYVIMEENGELEPGLIDKIKALV